MEEYYYWLKNNKQILDKRDLCSSDATENNAYNEHAHVKVDFSNYNIADKNANAGASNTSVINENFCKNTNHTSVNKSGRIDKAINTGFASLKRGE